jgi:hypothetical protein
MASTRAAHAGLEPYRESHRLKLRRRRANAAAPFFFGEKVMNTISDICWDATTWIDALTQNHADAAVQILVDRIVAALKRDPRMPTLTSETWRLLLADAAARSRDEFGRLIDGKVDLREVVRAIAEALEEETVVPKTNKRKSRQQANAETGGTP